jgi:hypothetical protein
MDATTEGSNVTEDICHEKFDDINPILNSVRFWIEGVCLVVVASIGLLGNFLTVLVIANLENSSR